MTVTSIMVHRDRTTGLLKCVKLQSGMKIRPVLYARDGKVGINPHLLSYKTAIFSNQHWSVDITYIKMCCHYRYLTAIFGW